MTGIGQIYADSDRHWKNVRRYVGIKYTQVKVDQGGAIRAASRTASILIPSELYLPTVATRTYEYIYICMFFYCCPHPHFHWFSF